jgi:hypothetical protein
MVKRYHRNPEASKGGHTAMRASLVVCVASGILLAAIPLALQAEARQGELAPATLRERGADGSRIIDWKGQSGLQVTGLCLPAIRSCLGSNESVDGRYFLPAAASEGRLVVEWRAVNDSLSVLEVTVGAWTKNGTSPLVFEFAGASAGEYAVHAEPMRPVAGSWDQRIDWFATFRVDTPLPTAQLAGRAGYTTLTGCALLLCDSLVEPSSDPIVAPWRAMGVLVVTWDPAKGSQSVSIPGTGFAATGPSPIQLNVDGLEAGEWALSMRPTSVATAPSRLEAHWTLDLVRHGQTSS